jgi:hypothetical protein
VWRYASREANEEKNDSEKGGQSIPRGDLPNHDPPLELVDANRGSKFDLFGVVFGGPQFNAYIFHRDIWLLSEKNKMREVGAEEVLGCEPCLLYYHTNGVFDEEI